MLFIAQGESFICRRYPPAVAAFPMNFYKRKRRMPTVIIVSLIDIFAILLIFVIVTTTFKRTQPAVIIKLPESSTAKPEANADDPALVTLTIAQTGEVFISDHPQSSVPLDQLAPAFKTVVASQRKLAINADTKAPFGTIVRV